MGGGTAPPPNSVFSIWGRLGGGRLFQLFQSFQQDYRYLPGKNLAVYLESGRTSLTFSQELVSLENRYVYNH